jgi:selenocysteine-specific elongation factor
MSAASEANDRSRILNINIGVLGHVDSGKTSLVKALSTSLSTAALDKNPQSQQRGITLDLGFSAFTLPLPHNLRQYERDYDFLQFTLVDCPGHASLIRTIIGGAQIIDMMILVIDANKGIQTQTAECIVIGEITTDKMIIVLNKVDMIPADERDTKLEKVMKRIEKVLSTTKFHDAPIVLTSAAVGGEKVASIGAQIASGAPAVPTLGVDNLLRLISESVTIPNRNVDAPFYFAIDHCFAIKGHGTVVTGTVLSGSISVNSLLEIPNMQIQRKVKSMQMFKKPVKYAKQGDRVGICVTHLDPKLIERGVAAAPNSVPQLSTVLCLVKKVRFFKTPCRSNTKFHVSIGHSTVVGNVVFFGAIEMVQMLGRRQVAANLAKNASDAEDFASLEAAMNEVRIDSNRKNGTSAGAGAGAGAGASSGKKSESAAANHEGPPGRQSVLNSTFQSSFPDVEFSFKEHYQYQEELMGMDGVKYGNEPVHWAVIQFQQPVFCPLGSLVIGSRLDTDTTDNTGLGSSHQCRLSFFGPVRYALEDDELSRLNIFHWKLKEGKVHKISDVRNGLCTELIGGDMFAEGSSISPFVGMKVNTERGNMGTIMGPYGSDGKFRVKFDPGIRVSVGSALRLRFKRFVYDKSRSMEQEGVDEVIDDTVPEPTEEMVVDDGEGGRSRKKASRKATASAATEASGPTPVTPMSPIATASPTASGLTLPMNFPTAAVTSVKISTPKSPATPPPLPVSTNVSATAAAATSTAPTPVFAANSVVAVGDGPRVGYIESIKAEGTDEVAMVAVVRDAFRMEENIKLYADCEVVGPNQETGILLGPFGKLGKCKVKFPDGTRVSTKVGDAVKINL